MISFLNNTQRNLWHSLDIDQAFKILETSERGLKSNQAEEKIKKHGLNTLPEEKPSGSFKILLNQLKSPLVYILLIAAIVSLVLGEYIDMGVILLAVIINTVVGFAQENKAERAVYLLRKMVHHTARVMRDGREIEINSQEVVPGDIIFLEAGDKIPADARLIQENDFQVNEAALTGESVPSSKKIEILAKGTSLADRENMVYMGTVITRGRAQAVVCQTGLESELGKITLMIKETKEEQTPLQVKLTKFSRFLSVSVSAICVLILIIGILEGENFFEMFMVSIAVAVSAIPEGLLVAITAVLAIGMQKILKHKALVKKLVAAETLGSTTVICSDKTGTLTEGKMVVAEILTASSKTKNFSAITKEKDLIFQTAVLCNDAVIENPQDDLKKWRVIGSPTETALILGATQMGLNRSELNQQQPRLKEAPFSSETKIMATLNQIDQNNFKIYVKGASEKIFDMVSYVYVNNKKIKLTSVRLKSLKKEYEKLTQKGLRVLGLAYQESKKNVLNLDKIKKEQSLVFVGFIALKDPLRPEIKETINLCQQAGIKIVIVTGDHKLTTLAIAKEIGLKVKKENVLEGADLDNLTDQEFKKKVNKIIIYSRVEPRHKLRIVDAWQAQGDVVAMTGDGVNDAPALKSADIGISLGSGTEVTKETADIILLDDNFKTIVAAIKQGRVIFDNIKKVILYLISDGSSEVVLVIGSLLLKLPLPILAVQILWINLVADGLPSIAMTFEPAEKDVMQIKPQEHSKTILDRDMKILISIIATITNVILFVLFYVLFKRGLDLQYVRTMIFATLGLDSLFYVFSCKSLRYSIFQTNIFSNWYLIGGIGIGLVMLLLAIYAPFFQMILRTVVLDFKDWLVILGLGVFEIILIEIGKYIFILKKYKKQHHQIEC